MAKKSKRRTGKCLKGHEPQQRLAVVKVGGDYGEVLFPIGSEAEIQTRRDELTERALEFHRKGLFIREITSSDFLQEMASDLARECKTGFQGLLAARFAITLLETYTERLKEALDVASWADIAADRPFVKATAPDGKHFVFKPPPNYDQKLVKICSDLIEPFFGPPTTQFRVNFWRNFTEWIWINQMAQAMEDLEGSIGTSALEQLRAEEMFNRVLTIFAESDEVPQEFARLANWYLQEFGDMLVSAPLPEPISLRQFEVLIGLVDRPDEQPAPIVGFNSLARQVEAVLLRPMTIHQISPRRFEELVAFGLEKSGFDEVRLTPQTRDGGFDIEAFRYRPIRERLLVECKRYAASRKVGRPTLDALLGVLHREKANQALLATTSSFSKEALGLLKDEQWRLQGMDLDDLLKFLRGLRPN